VNPATATVIVAAIAAVGAIAAAIISLFNRSKLSDVEESMSSRLSNVEGQLKVILALSNRHRGDWPEPSR
jgi:hypothetical protein